MLELSRFVLPSATLRRFMTKAPMPTLQFKCVPSGAFARDHGADRPGTIWLRSTSASLRRFMKKAMPKLQFKFAPSGAFARAAGRTGRHGREGRCVTQPRVPLKHKDRQSACASSYHKELFVLRFSSIIKFYTYATDNHEATSCFCRPGLHIGQLERVRQRGRVSIGESSLWSGDLR